MSDLTKLPEWPEQMPNWLTFRENEEEDRWNLAYERARADAAMARLRVAVEALKKASWAMESMSTCCNGRPSGVRAAQESAAEEMCAAEDVVNEALAQIGEIPEGTEGKEIAAP